MNRRLIIFIAILVSTALIILTGIQAYWIRSAVKLREANFQRSVADATGQLMMRLEKAEVARQVRKSQEYNSLLRTIDSLDYLIYLESEKLGVKPDTGGTFNYQRQQEWSEVFENNQWKLVKKSDSAKMIYPGSGNNRLQNKNLSERAMQLNRKKAFLLDQMFDEMFNSPFVPNIESRITKGQLDTLLKQTLNEKGIKARYEFGVFSEGRNIMVIEKNPGFQKELMEKGLFFQLFPGNNYSAPDYLMIWFPEQTKYLLVQMSGMLIVSASSHADHCHRVCRCYDRHHPAKETFRNEK